MRSLSAQPHIRSALDKARTLIPHSRGWRGHWKDGTHLFDGVNALGGSSPRPSLSVANGRRAETRFRSRLDHAPSGITPSVKNFHKGDHQFARHGHDHGLAHAPPGIERWAVLIVFDDFFAFFENAFNGFTGFCQKPVEAERKIFRCAIYTRKSTELPKRPAALALEVIGLGSRVGRQGSSSRLRSAIRKAAMPAAAAASMR
jgi:hypothetical protein